MAEIARNHERNMKLLHGFYVVGMKKDMQTGQYFGLARWIAKDIPLGGTRVKTRSRDTSSSLEQYMSSSQIFQDNTPASRQNDPDAALEVENAEATPETIGEPPVVVNTHRENSHAPPRKFVLQEDQYDNYLL